MRLDENTPIIREELNRTVKDFYTKGKYSHTDHFRTSITATITQVERVSVGMFGQRLGIELKLEDKEVFSRVFPRVYRSLNGKIIYQFDGIQVDGFCYIGRVINMFRNVNMHAKNKNIFSKMFVVPEEFRCFYTDNSNKDIAYINDQGELTVGGLLFTVFSFANAKMFEAAQKTKDIYIKTFLLSMIPGDDLCSRANEEELEKIFDTHFESPIRTYVFGQSLEQALLGKYLNRLERDGSFALELEKSEDVFRGISGSITKNAYGYCEVKINKGSNLGEFYREDYVLKVIDKFGFVEASSKVPPFMLVAYLYKKGITTFEKDCLVERPYKTDEDDVCPYLKLNKPKFYVDKNVRILALSNVDADVRMVHITIQSKINNMFVRLEKELYTKYNIPMQGYYSTMKEALSYLKINHDTKNRVVCIRNFFAHQVLLGDDFEFYGSWTCFNLQFIIDSFKSLFDELKLLDIEMGERYESVFVNQIICTLLSFKYGDIISFWTSVQKGGFVPDYEKRANIVRSRMGASVINDDVELRMGTFPARDRIMFNVKENVGYEHVFKYTVFNNSDRPFLFGGKEFRSKVIAIVLANEIDWENTFGGTLLERQSTAFVSSLVIQI